MKAITLHQPWAYFIMVGLKEVETRSWYTPYRGPLAIHAGKHHDSDGHELYLHQYGQSANFSALPFGVVIARCHLVACIPTHYVAEAALKMKEPFTPKHGWPTERLYGNYAAGRWAWILRGVQPVYPPIASRGFQKLWNCREMDAWAKSL
jgi:activating signal cointegrator 1